jgi:hypothetical protein
MNETKSQTEKIEVHLTVRGLAVLNAKIEKLNKRAKRLNVTPVKVEQVTPWTPRNRTDGGRKQDWADFEISTEIPCLSGWTFICRIEHTAAGNILAQRPGLSDDIDLSHFHNCPPTCEHCNKIRARKDTFVIQHEDGRMKQIGSTCLADVLGLGMTPEAAANLAVWLSDLHLSASGEGEGDDDFFEGGSCRVTHMPTLSFLSFVVVCANDSGFKTRKQCELMDNVSPTSEDAMFNMFPPRGLTDKERAELLEPSDEDREEAQAAIDWAKALEGKSEFDHNMKVVASNEMIEFRNKGIAAFIVQARRRSIEKEVERKLKNAALPESKHVGTLGKRLKKQEIVFLGTPFAGENDFGCFFIHRFRTAEGSDLVWKTSSNICSEPGTKFVSAFTPKKHTEFNDRPQTEVSRMKLETINA